MREEPMADVQKWIDALRAGKVRRTHHAEKLAPAGAETAGRFATGGIVT
jgi:hypothetical protein